MTQKQLTGTIKFYMTAKGYGFITPDGAKPDDEDADRFFHHSQLNVPKMRIGEDWHKSIPNGTRVTFTPVDNEKGLAAMNVTPI